MKNIKGISFLYNKEIGYLEIIEEKDGISEISFLGNIGIETRNRADQLISATEKTLKENPDKVNEGDKKNIEAAIEELKKVKDGDDKSAIDSAMEKLSQASHKFAEELYKEAQAQAQAQQQAGAGANAGSDKKDEDVAEAEVVD